MPEVKKLNMSSYRVLRTLLCLFERNMTMNELVEHLDKFGYGPYNNFIVTKYVHTLKACGIDIQKFQNKYSLINFPLGMKFSDTDTKLLFDIKSRCEKIFDDDIGDSIARFFEKIHLSYFKSGTGLLSSPNFKIIKNLEAAYKTKTPIVITHNDMSKEKGTVEDVSINKDGKFEFSISTKDGISTIRPDDILYSELATKNKKLQLFEEYATFELTGRLASRYQLRENEHVIRYKTNGDLVIANEYEDLEVLMQRLRRYDSYCKVIGPDKFVKLFKDSVNNSLANYNIDKARKSKKFQLKEEEKLKARGARSKRRKKTKR